MDHGMKISSGSERERERSQLWVHAESGQSTCLVDGETNTQILQPHLLLLAAVLLHECDETGALPIAVIILEEVHSELGVVDKGVVVTAATGCPACLEPASRYDDGIPVLHCKD